jgi:hypothetical protein
LSACFELTLVLERRGRRYGAWAVDGASSPATSA